MIVAIGAAKPRRLGVARQTWAGLQPPLRPRSSGPEALVVGAGDSVGDGVALAPSAIRYALIPEEGVRAPQAASREIQRLERTDAR